MFRTSLNNNAPILQLISDWELVTTTLTQQGLQQAPRKITIFFFPIICPLKSPTIACDCSVFPKEEVGGNK